jgi:hypothetical protein
MIIGTFGNGFNCGCLGADAPPSAPVAAPVPPPVAAVAKAHAARAWSMHAGAPGGLRNPLHTLRWNAKDPRAALTNAGAFVASQVHP